MLELIRSQEPVERVHVLRGPRMDELVAAAHARGIPVETGDRAALDHLAGTPQHQGVVAVAPPFRYAPLSSICERGSAVALDGVQDPRNLGAILRTVRAAGVGGVVLPADRSVGVTSVVATSAAGLLFGLPIARVPNLVRALEELKEDGFWTVGLVPRDGVHIYTFELPSRPLLVVGGEGEGLRPLVRRTCDFAVTIPMAPSVDSLNVSVATGIALYELVVRSKRT